MSVAEEAGALGGGSAVAGGGVVGAVVVVGVDGSEGACAAATWGVSANATTDAAATTFGLSMRAL
jgi:hypothetical protein